jgi:hypothetical protein
VPHRTLKTFVVHRVFGNRQLEWTILPGHVTATGETASKTIVLEAGSVGSFFRVELVP